MVVENHLTEIADIANLWMAQTELPARSQIKIMVRIATKLRTSRSEKYTALKLQPRR